MLTDTLIPVAVARTQEHDPKKNPLTDLRVVRIYPSSPGRMAIQIRTEGVTTPHGRVPKHCYSYASLGLEEAIRLRTALDSWIGEWSEEQRAEAGEK